MLLSARQRPQPTPSRFYRHPCYYIYIFFRLLNEFHNCNPFSTEIPRLVGFWPFSSRKIRLTLYRGSFTFLEITHFTPNLSRKFAEGGGGRDEKKGMMAI